VAGWLDGWGCALVAAEELAAGWLLGAAALRRLLATCALSSAPAAALLQRLPAAAARLGQRPHPIGLPQVPRQLQQLFEANYDLLLSIFNPDGWLEITYLDDALRAGRDDKGNIFLLERGA
jgi:hypothetical protein